LRVEGCGFRAEDIVCRLQGLEFRVWGSGMRDAG